MLRKFAALFVTVALVATPVAAEARGFGGGGFGGGGFHGGFGGGGGHGFGGGGYQRGVGGYHGGYYGGYHGGYYGPHVYHGGYYGPYYGGYYGPHFYHGGYYYDDGFGTALAVGVGLVGLAAVVSAANANDHVATATYPAGDIGPSGGWANPDSAQAPLRDGAVVDGHSCVQTREYQTKVTIGGRVEDAYGTACLQPDGSWLRGPLTVDPHR